MELLTGKHAAKRLRGIILPKFQVHRFSVDLTVKSVWALVSPSGKVDFGGTEYEPAGRARVGGEKRDPEEKYFWWHLGRGTYLIEFNETVELATDEMAILEPDSRLVRAGASHLSMFLRGTVAPIEALLHVGAAQIELKQNARVSRLRLFLLGGNLSEASAAGSKTAAARMNRGGGKRSKSRA